MSLLLPPGAENPSYATVRKLAFWRLMGWVFLQAGCTTCHPTNSVEALNSKRWSNLEPLQKKDQ